MKHAIAGLVGLMWCVSAWGQGAEHRGRLSVQVSGMHRSEVLTNGFLRTMLVGGHLERSALEGMYAAMERSGMGHIGVAAGAEVSWQGDVGPGGLRPRVALDAHGLMAATATLEAFGLAFLGNAHARGTQQVLTGTSVEYLQWNRLAFGLSDASEQRWVEVGAYLAGLGGEATVLEGAVAVSEGVDALEAQITGRFDAWEHRGWGLGISTRQAWGEERWAAFEVRDLGVVRYAEGERFSIDTSLVTTGLPWSGPGWTVEGIQADGFGEELTARRATGEGWQLLPARLLVEGGWRWSAPWSAQASVEVGGWMPRPQGEVRLQWHVESDWAVEAAVRAGGWGGVRPVLRGEWRRPEGRLAVCWEDPVGGFSAAGYGRGMQLIWSTNL